MIEVIVRCDLCPASITVNGRVDFKIELPNGWIGTSVASAHHGWFDGNPGPKQFCSSEHDQAFSEAVKACADETMAAAKLDFAKRLRLKIQAAISVVDALATLSPEEKGDRRRG